MPVHYDNSEEIQRRATQLRLLRELRGLSQKQLAKKLGVRPTYISRIEASEELPSIQLLDHASEILNGGLHVLLL